jgi:hypothetical protein
MPIDSCSGLGAEIAVPVVEVECTYSVFAADALEEYSTFDPTGGVVSHGLIVVLAHKEGCTHRWAVEGNERSPSAHTTDPLRDFRSKNSYGRVNALS